MKKNLGFVFLALALLSGVLLVGGDSVVNTTTFSSNTEKYVDVVCNVGLYNAMLKDTQMQEISCYKEYSGISCLTIAVKPLGFFSDNVAVSLNAGGKSDELTVNVQEGNDYKKTVELRVRCLPQNTDNANVKLVFQETGELLESRSVVVAS